MHSQRIQEAAAAYLREVDTRPGEHWTRGEVERHLVAFAERVLEKYGPRPEAAAVQHQSARGYNSTPTVAAASGTTPDGASNLSGVWAVVYGNYDPPETDSLWTTEEEATKRAGELNESGDSGMWEVQRRAVNVRHTKGEGGKCSPTS